MPCNFEEPTLRELLEDPIIGLLMARDGVRRDALADLFTGLRPITRVTEREPVDTAPA